MALSEVNKLAVITCLAVLGTALVCVISAYIFTCAYVSRSLRSLKDSPPKAENSSTPDQHPEIPLFDLWMPQPSALHAREHELLTQVPRWDIEEEFSMLRYNLDLFASCAVWKSAVDIDAAQCKVTASLLKEQYPGSEHSNIMTLIRGLRENKPRESALVALISWSFSSITL
jgi:hypothetical protein